MDGALDDTVPANRPVTTRDLLTFTFGFGFVAEMFAANSPWPIVAAADAARLATFGPPDPDGQADPDSWIAGLGALPLMAQPGQRWMYNTAASVLGVLLARAAGQPLADVMRTRLFEPLGMRDTAFWTTATERLATSYRPTSGGLIVHDPADGAWSRPPAFCDASGGLISTVDDLLAFARMLLADGTPVLTKRAAHAMTSDQLTAEQKAAGGFEPDFFTGQSWGFCQLVLDSGAFGWDGGLGTSWLVDPNNDLTVVVLTQRMTESAQAPTVHAAIQQAAYQALR